MADGNGFTVKDIVLEMKDDIKDFIAESKRRDDLQDEKIGQLKEDMAKVKTDAKWTSGILGSVSGLLGSLGHGLFK